MPSYELMLIMKSTLNKPQFAAAVKRNCEMIIKSGGFIRGLENLGEKQLPYKMPTGEGPRATHGKYFLVNFDAPGEKLPIYQSELEKDRNVLRQSILKKEDFLPPCTNKPCVFEESRDPEKERRAWKRRTTYTIRHKKDRQNYLDFK